MITIRFTSDTSVNPEPVFMLKGGRDPLLLSRIGFGELGNFGHLPLWTEGNNDSNGFKDVSAFYYLGEKWHQWLLDIQPYDYQVERNGVMVNVTRSMIDNWLYHPVQGRPYFDKRDTFSFGTCVVPSRPVRLKVDSAGKPIITYKRVYYQDIGWQSNEPMVELDGFTPDMMDEPISELVRKGYMQQWTSITYQGAVNYKPSGYTIYNPVWSQDVWPSNTGRKYIPLIYLAD